MVALDLDSNIQLLYGTYFSEGLTTLEFQSLIQKLRMSE